MPTVSQLAKKQVWMLLVKESRTCEGAFCFASPARLSWASHSLVLGQSCEQLLAFWCQGHRPFRCCKLTFNNSLLPGELLNSYHAARKSLSPSPVFFSVFRERQPWDYQYPGFLSKTPVTKQSGQFNNQHLDAILPLWHSVRDKTFAEACYKYTTQAQITPLKKDVEEKTNQGFCNYQRYFL